MKILNSIFLLTTLQLTQAYSCISMSGIYTYGDNAVTMEVKEYDAPQCSTNNKRLALAFPMLSIPCKPNYRAWITPDLKKYYYQSPTFAGQAFEQDVHMFWLTGTTAQFWANIYCDCGGYQCKFPSRLRRVWANACEIGKGSKNDG